MLAWLFVGALIALCGVLGVLQYRWIGEVSVAERERLQGSLEAGLNRLSQEFNAEIAAACRALLPSNFQSGSEAIEPLVEARYEQWKTAGRHAGLFRRIAIATTAGNRIVLRNLNLEDGTFATAGWPPEWGNIRNRMELRLTPERWPDRNPPGPPPEVDGLVFALPIVRAPRGGTPPVPFGRRAGASLIFELNARYVRDVLLPDLVQRYLGSQGRLDYEVEVVSRTVPPKVIYQSDPHLAKSVAASPDASAALFEVRYDRIMRPWGPPGMPDRGPGPGREPDSGQWRIFVRHRAGSLEAVVARTRWLNLSVTAGVLLLMLASVAALIRFTRRAQRLAELQMDFVAGVSHELRTPLTVIHTAAYNLRGKLANNPSQVERYGTLIQHESGRLKELVEQVLLFAGAQAGRVIREPELFSVASVIEESMESSRALIQSANCVVEKTIEDELPLVLGDPQALKRALQNLLGNAAKYGAEGGNWIGVFASRAGDNGRSLVEIRVADRGPGIPVDEQKHVFDPFFRGRRALQAQAHGTGLGLNLVKRIVEAHGGSVGVKSEPMKGTEFVVRIPAALVGEAP